MWNNITYQLSKSPNNAKNHFYVLKIRKAFDERTKKYEQKHVLKKKYESTKKHEITKKYEQKNDKKNKAFINKKSVDKFKYDAEKITNAIRKFSKLYDVNKECPNKKSKKFVTDKEKEKVIQFFRHRLLTNVTPKRKKFSK